MDVLTFRSRQPRESDQVTHKFVIKHCNFTHCNLIMLQQTLYLYLHHICNLLVSYVQSLQWLIVPKAFWMVASQAVNIQHFIGK